MVALMKEELGVSNFSRALRVEHISMPTVVSHSCGECGTNRLHTPYLMERAIVQTPVILCGPIALFAFIAIAAEPTVGKTEIYPQLRVYLEARTAEFDQIPIERKNDLKKIALFVKSRTKAKQPTRLTFICTHNSRRSHISQIWAAAAASYYDIGGVETFSGGTEATAFNPRAIAAIKRAGLKVEKSVDGKNSRYEVRFTDTNNPLICYSKIYNEAPNPKEDFCAVMTCSQADKSCPIIDGSLLRVAIPYEDPKASDDKPEEEKTYDERSRQICREMLYLFSEAGN